MKTVKNIIVKIVSKFEICHVTVVSYVVCIERAESPGSSLVEIWGIPGLTPKPITHLTELV